LENKDVELQKIEESRKKKKNFIERKLDSKANVILSFRQILPPALTISFAKENIIILSSGYNTARM
jgi:hypothetical protein